MLAPGCSSASEDPTPTPTPVASVEPEPSDLRRPEGLRGDPPEAPIPAYLAHLPGFAEASAAQPAKYSGSSVERGRKLYGPRCQGCHGAHGQGVPARGYTTARPPRDLSVKAYYKYGSSERAVFRTIKYGLPGSPMGTYVGIMPDEQIWDLAHYVRSLQQDQGPASSSE